MSSGDAKSERGSWRRTWLLPLLAIAGRRLAIYLALYPLHLVLAGLALAAIAVKAGTGDADWLFWLAYGWVALQVLAGPRVFVPTALALAFVALQATDGDRDAIFWICFSWLAVMILGGGIAIRATRAHRKRARERARAEAGDGFEKIFANLFGDSGFSWTEGAPDTDASDETIDGTAREVVDDVAADDLVDELERLAGLRRSGALSEDEYLAAKRKLLG